MSTEKMFLQNIRRRLRPAVQTKQKTLDAPPPFSESPSLEGARFKDGSYRAAHRILIR